MQPVMQVNGGPIFSIPMGVPLYRTLISGAPAPTSGLRKTRSIGAGYGISSDSFGTYGSGTVDAVDVFQLAQNVTETGQISLDQFVSYAPGSIVQSLSTAVGDRVTAGATIASLGVPGSMVAQASVSQSDFTKVQVGQSVALSFDALTGQTATGVVFGAPDAGGELGQYERRGGELVARAVHGDDRVGRMAEGHALGDDGHREHRGDEPHQRGDRADVGGRWLR